MLDFVGIGAQKAGTTWLYHQLCKHPDIDFPAGKEIHFWDLKCDKGIDWYRQLFPSVPGRVQGEITPAYAMLGRDRVRQVRESFPDIRLVYLMRNPIERAWSAALMALSRAEMELEEASDQWFIDHFRSAGSLRRGDYEACLRTWLACFPAEQLMLARFERIIEEPRQLLADTCRHLGVSPQPMQVLDPEALGQRIRPVAGERSENIRESLLPSLREIYYPKIELLGRFLGDDLTAWYI